MSRWDEACLEASKVVNANAQNPGPKAADGTTLFQRQLLKPKFRLAVLESAGLIRSDNRWELYSSLGRFSGAMAPESAFMWYGLVGAPALVVAFFAPGVFGLPNKYSYYTCACVALALPVIYARRVKASAQD